MLERCFEWVEEKIEKTDYDFLMGFQVVLAREKIWNFMFVIDMWAKREREPGRESASNKVENDGENRAGMTHTHFA